MEQATSFEYRAGFAQEAPPATPSTAEVTRPVTSSGTQTMVDLVVASKITAPVAGVQTLAIEGTVVAPSAKPAASTTMLAELQLLRDALHRQRSHLQRAARLGEEDADPELLRLTLQQIDTVEERIESAAPSKAAHDEIWRRLDALASTLLDS